MKKLLLALLVLVATSTLSAQTNESYTKFQGIWYGGSYDDEKYIVIFVNSTYMIKADNFTIGIFTIGEYTINGNIITLNTKNAYDDESGILAPIDDFAPITLEYLFSGDKLILAADGEIATFAKL